MQELAFPTELYPLVPALVSAVLRLEPQLPPGITLFAVQQFLPSLARLVVVQMEPTDAHKISAAMRCELMVR